MRALQSCCISKSRSRQRWKLQQSFKGPLHLDKEKLAVGKAHRHSCFQVEGAGQYAEHIESSRLRLGQMGDEALQQAAHCRNLACRLSRLLQNQRFHFLGQRLGGGHPAPQTQRRQPEECGLSAVEFCQCLGVAVLARRASKNSQERGVVGPANRMPRQELSVQFLKYNLGHMVEGDTDLSNRRRSSSTVAVIFCCTLPPLYRIQGNESAPLSLQVQQDWLLLWFYSLNGQNSRRPCLNIWKSRDPDLVEGRCN
jgi:hypothetical protein